MPLPDSRWIDVAERAAGQVPGTGFRALVVRGGRARRRPGAAVADAGGGERAERQDAADGGGQLELHGQVRVIAGPGQAGDLGRPVVGAGSGLVASTMVFRRPVARFRATISTVRSVLVTYATARPSGLTA